MIIVVRTTASRAKVTYDKTRFIMNNNKYKILVVDDDLMTRGMISNYLQNNGFYVETSASAEEGLDRVIKNQPDLIILDIMMARMNGWEMLDYIRKEMGIDEISMPVIVMSAVVGSELEMEYIRHRANDWIIKPIRPLSLILQKVKTILGINAIEQASSGGELCN